MRIALLQDEIYLPSFGGGTKANRCLLEAFARRGHECVALSRALTSSSDGPNDAAEFVAAMSERGNLLRSPEAGVFAYHYHGVQVEALDFASLDQRVEYLVRRLRSLQPDWVLVTDDKRRFMLECALRTVPDRVLLLLQTIVQLPFGPLSVSKSETYTQQIKQAQAICVISRFMQDYIRDHSELEAHLLPIPVYGKGPFRDLARFDRGYVTMINPCELKGVSIFLALAERHRDVSFAAVPTWGADDGVMQRLDALPNVRPLTPSDDIDEIFAQTRVLLVPSLWPETFGYVVPEAMLRGIPVLASNVGGLPEAKLGVDYLLRVDPGEFRDGSFWSPPQDIDPWSAALTELLQDEQTYARCSQQSRQAATQFVAGISVAPFEALMTAHITPPIHPEVQQHIDMQPYTVLLDGLKLTIDKDVFPPDLGRCAQNLSRLVQEYRPHSALDMGCGSGYLAPALKRSGAAEVWASDVHPPAVACAKPTCNKTTRWGLFTLCKAIYLNTSQRP